MAGKTIIKRIVSAVVTIAIVVSMTPLMGQPYSAQAKMKKGTKKMSSPKKAPAAITGKCGDNLTYSFDSSTGTLTISGTGEMYNYDYKDNKSPFTSDTLNKTLKKVIIEEGTTSIGAEAFEGCSALTDVELPISLKVIGLGAFVECSSLVNIDIPNNLETIGEEAFTDCSAIKSITIPASVKRIGLGTFQNCEALETVNLSEGLEEIGPDAFGNCPKLNNITIPVSVKLIDDEAFHDCSALSSVSLPPNISYIAAGTFLCCGLKSVTIPSNVSRIGFAAFFEDTSLESVVIEDGATEICRETFDGCSSLKSIEIPSSVKTIESDALDDTGATIYGYTGSYAETYANEKKYTFVALDGKDSGTNVYSITYDLDGGDDMGSYGVKKNYSFYTEKTASFSLAAPEKDGYEFTGWTGSNSNTPQTTVTIIQGSTGNKAYSAHWKKTDGSDTTETYTITYILNEGIVAENKTKFTADTETFTLNNPSREGYTFTGWTGSNGTTPQTDVTISKGSTGNRTYTANWKKNTDPTPNEYTIKYNLDGGTATGNNPTSYTSETATFTLSNPTRDGYTFTGWTWDRQTTPKTTVTVAQGSSGNKVYTANWQKNPNPAPKEYTITYNLAGGIATGNNPTSYTSETATFALSNPTRDGYTFTGWTWDGQTTPKTTVTVAQGSTGNKVYTANWQKNPDPTPTEYTITYNFAGGIATGNNPTSYTSETTTFTLSNPTREGYTFTGWTWDGQTTPQVTVTVAQGSTGNKVFTAHWQKNEEPTPAPSVYSITYNLDGGTVSGNPESYTKDTDTFTLNNPTKQGYTFRGWVGSNGVTPVTSVIIQKGTTGNLSYIAIWEKNDSPSLTYTITYALDGGVASGNPTSYTALSDAFTLNNPTRDGYTFTGWTGSNGDTQQTSVTIPKGTTGNLAYTAHWQKNETPAVKYTITYHLAGGSASGNPEVYTADDTITLNNPTREGYTFTGWTGSNGSTKQMTVVIKKGTTGNLSYTANWKRTPKSYTITYNLNGGSVAGNPTSYTDETDTFTLKNPSRNGYTFTGWTGSNGNTPQTSVSIQKGTSENLTYTANWQLREGTYQITYTLNGGTVSGNPEIYTSSTDTFTLVNPTRSGYIFTGWTGSNGSTPQTSVTISKGTTGDLTYYANWQANLVNYTITYNLNGGSDNGTNITSYNADTNTFYLNNPYRNGYFFTGWTGSNGTIPQMYVTVARGTTGDLTFTANWSEASSGSNGDSNNGSNGNGNSSSDDSEDDLTGDDVTDEDEQELIDSIQTKKGKVTKLTAGNKKVTLKFKKVTLNGATVKYQVAIKQKGTNKWKKSYVSNTKKTFKKLKSGKTYWISVRPYIEIDGEKYFGKWAETKVKTTK